MWKRLSKYLLRILMTLRWAKESQSMDYQKTASTFITKEGRLVSTDNGDWIYEFMPKKEADNMDAKLESIEQNSNTKRGDEIIRAASL